MHDKAIAVFVVVMLIAVAVLGLAFGSSYESIPPMTDPIEVTENTPETYIPTESTTAPVETTEPTEATIESIPATEETIPETVPETVPEATEAPTTAETEPEEGMSELEMLACVIYQEAGGNGSCDDCRRRVADVVLNRVNDRRFPNTIYEVLTAPRQYGKFHWTGIVWPARHTNPGEAEAVARAWRIAEEVLNGQHSELYGQGYIWQAEFVQGKEGFWHCGHYFGKS